MFDPHASWLPGVTTAQPGIKIRFPSSPLVSHFPDSFQPYQVFGCDMHERYNGTLFRFPLRTEQLAPLSEIKPQAYESDDVLKLFENFKNQAAHALLFLKSLKLVELWVRDNAESEPRQVFSAELSPSSLQQQQQQQHPQAAVKAFVSHGGGKDAFYQQLKATKDSDLPSSCTTVDVKLRQQEQDIERKQRWLVCNLLAGGAARQLALQGAAPAGNSGTMPRGWVPWAGVAAPINVDKQVEELEPFQGRAFCFLPLPTLTQLPVHVNGLFELSSNRRDLWHGQDLSSGAGKIRADWNSALLADGAAAGYVKLLLAATKIEKFDLAAFYALWPQKLDVSQPWNEVVDAFYRLIVDQPVVWSAAQGGIWVAPSDAILVSSSSKEMNKTATAASSPSSLSLESRMASMLLDEGLPVLDTRIPDAVVENLLRYHPQLALNNILTPAFLRCHLAEKGRVPASAEKESGSHAACLQYCLIDSPWNGGRVEDLQDLMGVPLLPLADGSLGFLLAATAGVKPLLLPLAESTPGTGVSASEEENDCVVDLFKPKLAGRLVSLSMSTSTDLGLQQQQLREQLVQLAESKLVNLRILDAVGIAEEVLPVYLPASWHNQLCVTIDSTTSSGSTSEGSHLETISTIDDSHLVSVEWVLKLWKVLGAAEKNRITSIDANDSNAINSGLEALSKWPLIPAEKQKSPVFVAPTPSAGLLEEGAFTEAAMSALSKLGCAFISLSVSKQLPEMVKKSRCIHPATGLGVLEALQHSKETGTDSLSDEEKDALRAFLLQPRWFEGENVKPESITQLLSLPIYRCCTLKSGSSSSNISYSSTASSGVMFRDLVDAGEKILVPDGFSEYAALDSKFVYSSSSGEAQVLVKVSLFYFFYFVL